MSLLNSTGGIPHGYFTRTGAVVMGLAVAATLIGTLIAYGWLANRLTEPGHAPACYGSEVANYTPRNEVTPLQGAKERDGTSPDQRLYSHYVQAVQQAAARCTPKECGPKDWEAYRSAIFWYLSARLRDLRRADERYGDNGLRRIRSTYDTPADRDVDDGLRARYRAGIFRINDFRAERDGKREAIAILVHKGSDALRPCRRSDVGSR